MDSKLSEKYKFIDFWKGPWQAYLAHGQWNFARAVVSLTHVFQTILSNESSELVMSTYVLIKKQWQNISARINI